MGQYYNVLVDEKVLYDRSVDGDYIMAKLMEHSWWRNPFVCSLTALLYNEPHRVAWVGDYSDEINKDLHRLAWGDSVEGGLKPQTIHESMIDLYGKYLINYDKKEYVDCSQYWDDCRTEDGWCVHPLPLLTCIGNGLGGGDYHSENGEEYIGTWANDMIEVSKTKPDDYEQIRPIFKED